MKKLVITLCFAIASCTIFAQHREELKQENIGCVTLSEKDYLHLDDVMQGQYDFYLLTEICGLASGKAGVAPQVKPGSARGIMQTRDGWYSLPLKKNYESTVPVASYVKGTTAVLTFSLVSHAGQSVYTYLLMDFTKNGIYCFEIDSAALLKEDNIITKYEVAKLTALLPVAVKI